MLAYLDGRVAGWVHADRRGHLPRLDGWEVPHDAAMGVIACYVVRPDLRRQGLSRQLMAAACDHLRELGCSYADAYPVTEVPADHPALGRDALDYHGSLSMYRSAGFEVLEQRDNVSHVRKRLPE